jgi:ABC-2 type transport system permease protein
MTSLRSTYWVLAVFVAVTVGLNAVLFWGLLITRDNAQEMGQPLVLSDFYLIEMMSAGLIMFGNLTIAILGSLVITNEYSSGLIRATFTAAPRRLGVAVGKCSILAAVALLASLLATALTFFIGRAMLADTGINTTLFHGSSLRVFIGIQLYVMTVAVFALMVGLLIRSSAAAIGAVVGVIFVLPMAANTVSSVFMAGAAAGELQAWQRYLLYFFNCLPTEAGSHLLSAAAESSPADPLPSLGLGPWSGFGVMWAWVAVAAVAALWRLLSRDA